MYLPEAIELVTRYFTYRADKITYFDAWNVLTPIKKGLTALGDCEDYALTVLWLVAGGWCVFLWHLLITKKYRVYRCFTADGEPHVVASAHELWFDNFSRQALSRARFFRETGHMDEHEYGRVSIIVYMAIGAIRGLMARVRANKSLLLRRAYWVWVICNLVIAIWVASLGIAAEIPRQAQQHRALLTREARAQWGLDAPVATFAGQIHQESRWNELAVSPVGARGLAQFMPATAKWLPRVAPQTGKPSPFSPAWAIRAMVAYDLWLWARARVAASDCDRWSLTLAAYNGGLGWVQRDQAQARMAGLNPGMWNHAAMHNAGRSAANFKENRAYPTRILHHWTPLYREAGWGTGGCDVR